MHDMNLSDGYIVMTSFPSMDLFDISHHIHYGVYMYIRVIIIFIRCVQ